MKQILFLFIISVHLTALASDLCSSLFHPSNNMTVESEPVVYSEDAAEILQTNGYSVGKAREIGDRPQENFITDRGFSSYFRLFGDIVYKILLSMTAHDIVVDGGSGDAVLSDFVHTNKPQDYAFQPEALARFNDYLLKPLSEKPSYVGITYSLLGRTIDYFQSRLQNPEKFRLILGRYFEQIPIPEISKGKRVKLLTDFYGILSYTPRIDLVFQKYMKLLDKDGVLLIGGTPRLTLDGRDDFITWLKKIQGIEVTVFNDGVERGYLIRKTSDLIRIPELEITKDMTPGKPPYRFYRSTSRYLESMSDSAGRTPQSSLGNS
jgi:hypothetical protein